MTLDLDIILAAHGAGDDSPANDRVRQWARDLEASEVGARVVAAFHQGAPSYEEALHDADRPHRIVIPCLTSDGYHAARVRHAAGRASEQSGRTVYVAPPVGRSGSVTFGMANRIRERLREIGGETSRTLVVVVGHGTARYPTSAAATRELADAIPRLTRARACAAFLDEFPTVEEAIANPRGYRTILVIPFLVGGGRHGLQDLPARVASGIAHRGDGVHVEILDALANVHMQEAFEDAIDEGRFGRTVVRAGARGSLLSRRQVEAFARRVAPFQVDVRLRPILTPGDIDLTTPIAAFGAEDVFTGPIDAALLAGSVDVTVHSLKDLPLDRPDGVFEAYLSRGSAHDVLVSRDRIPLDQLPSRPRVGVSCERRALQLRKLRPDIRPVSIRGAIPYRIDALDRGEYDALTLAEAGLQRLGLSERVAQRFSMQEVVPAPGQGAIVVRCRADSSLRFLLQRIDDRETRLAVEAELAFARLARAHDAGVAAAHATVIGGAIQLLARRIDVKRRVVVDRLRTGAEPAAVALAAAQATGFARRPDERAAR